MVVWYSRRRGRARIQFDAAQHSAYTRQYLAHTEGLADIIVGSDFQAKNAVNLLIAAVSIMMDAR